MIIAIAMNISDHYCLKEILLVVSRFHIFSMDIQGVPNSLFLILRSKGSSIVSVPLVINNNSIFLRLKTITISLIGFLQTNFSEFQTFPLPKHASFCDMLKQSCLYLPVFEMLMYYLNM